MQFGETFVNFVWPSIFMKHSRVGGGGGGGGGGIDLHPLLSAHPGSKAVRASGHISYSNENRNRFTNLQQI